MKYRFLLCFCLFCFWLIALPALCKDRAAWTPQTVPDLLRRATRIKDMGDPEAQGMWAMPRWPFAYWLRGPRLLYFCKGYRHGEQAYFEWRLYDVKTGRNVCPPAFDTLFRRLDGNALNLHLSSDGKIALWTVSDQARHLRGATLDGRRAFDFKRGYKDFDVTWFPDSRHWIEWEASRTSDRFVRAHIYALEGSGDAHLLRTLPMATTCPIVPDWFAAQPLVSPGLDGILRVAWTEKRKRNNAQIQVFPLTGTLNAPTVTYSLPLPAGAEVRDCAVSPEQSRIAWLLEMPVEMPTSQGRLHKTGLMPISPPPKATLSLWVSRGNGADLRRLGSAVVVNKDVGGWNLANLRWLPDGKRVSFTARQWLWTLKVD